MPLARVALSVCALAVALTSAAGRADPPDLLRADIDPTVYPGDDFFTYANGAWLKAHSIPASEASWGIGEEVQEDLYGKLRAINEHAAAQLEASPGSDEQKIGDFWSLAMDAEKAEQLGLTPLQAQLASTQHLT